MHEMAYAEGILGVALDVSDGGRVRTIKVQLGDLHAIVADSLQFCFTLAAEQTPAANATLQVQVVKGDAFQVDAVELEDGWRYRPEATNVCV